MIEDYRVGFGAVIFFLTIEVFLGIIWVRN